VMEIVQFDEQGIKTVKLHQPHSPIGEA